MMKMFWSRKYAVVAVVVLVVRKLFRLKGERGAWVSGVITGSTVIFMNLGVGLLCPMSRNQILFGIAEGVLAGSVLVFTWMLLGRILYRKPKAAQVRFYPGEERICGYTKAFSDLSKAFLNVPASNRPAVVGLDDYERVQAAWGARMDEQRIAVATQLTEISGIMEGAMRRAYETTEDTGLEKRLKSQLHKKGVLLKTVHVYENEQGRTEVYLNIRTKRRRCVSNKDVAQVLSEVLGIAMMPSFETRAFVRGEYMSTCFVERTNFEVVYGVERCVGDCQQISGDSFSFLKKEEGVFLASLSDGMGTGLTAYQESEKVVDLLEQFLEAGFSKETAVKMINSALVLSSDGKTFSTMDISSIDLYTGKCEILKIGAASSFIKRGGCVECITSTSLPAGMFHHTDLDKTSRQLLDGDMLIMVTDGVLDVLPSEHCEKLMKDIILEHATNHPRELAEYILNRVRQYKNGRSCDDMTVLVVGIWGR